MNELNLTPTQSVILIIICLVILALLLCYESYVELDIIPKTEKVEENTTDYVQERYGAYIWLSNKHFN
ncbi:hypothetical protein EA456_04740 [Streptococcus dysgalactiae subsp. dysgalactiae]|uniref:hypothetical protein n=1 Tax=Streptococcus TaxID=1301 RepID=UPI000617D647|nr:MULTISPECIES: hypothetical protein [Streptococcus]KKC19258.1 hypothetical protein WH14_06235 [Streptococcus dysgalactiae subsp. equisimilis]MCL6222547.1 hypothetical protein [Streptococcus dysgalactiae subsp. equisimilis]MCY7235080.1 hypothetical protein [Streptococcus dysgalactiae]QGG99843.1 hypothetical protein EA456_04740 [Streptococcus dysgalactiae subsp. dysgalactiae]QQC50523.1 hypothetical protein I6H74_05065 [Streptococcus dysgalactiae]